MKYDRALSSPFLSVFKCSPRKLQGSFIRKYFYICDAKAPVTMMAQFINYSGRKFGPVSKLMTDFMSFSLCAFYIGGNTQQSFREAILLTHIRTLFRIL